MRYWGKSLNITLMRLVDDGQFGTFSGEVAVSVWDLPRKE